MISRTQLERWFVKQWAKNTLWQFLLRPLSWVFTSLATLRRLLYACGILKSERIAVPVIVVGSIVVGGSGKTPTLIALVNAMQKQGFSPGVISRGYGADEYHIGDEPMMIAARTGVPVVCDAKRTVAARRLLLEHPSVNIIVSDDGLQHYALQRDIELVVLDGARGPGTGATLPAGPFREPISRLFKKPVNTLRAVVWHGSPNPQWQASLDADLRSKLVDKSFNMHLGKERFVQLAMLDGALNVEAFRARVARKSIVACAGIAHPERFFKHLEAKSIVLKAKVGFGDHHIFSEADLAFPRADIILMTQKDAVKCIKFHDPRIWYMQVDAFLEDAFWVWFFNAVNAQNIRK
jgi:tetraacyldisaccharide 4'-kinase